MRRLPRMTLARWFRVSCVAGAATLAGCATTPLPAPSPAPAPTPAVVVAPAPVPAPAPAPYAAPGSWLCLPGRTDICARPVTASVPGHPAVVSFPANASPPIDCFYAYPTVSADATPNSDLVAGPEEERAVRQQLAPFGSQCRLFAPMYRQVTLAGLRARMAGGPAPDGQLAYDDLRDAWRHYLAHDNGGRGVVLIGHSQGARMLGELLAREIEGTPMHARIVSALLIGANIAVPRGRDVGGTFRATPLCRDASQVGCLVAYTSHRAEAPPPATANLGRLGGANTVGVTDPATQQVACTNPGALRGGKAPLRSLMPTRENLLGQPTDRGGWGNRARGLGGEFVALDDVLAAECVQNGPFSYLAIGAQQAGWTAADIPGDVTVNNAVVREWGLHLVDMNLAMGDLLDIVRQQALAYAARR